LTSLVKLEDRPFVVGIVVCAGLKTHTRKSITIKARTPIVYGNTAYN